MTPNSGLSYGTLRKQATTVDAVCRQRWLWLGFSGHVGGWQHLDVPNGLAFQR